MFVIGGFNRTKTLTSIERFDYTKSGGLWELIELGVAGFTERIRPLVCELNGTELLILGGKDSVDYKSKDDVWVFNTNTNIAYSQKMSEDMQACYAFGNQSDSYGSNSVSALVTTNDVKPTLSLLQTKKAP